MKIFLSPSKTMKLESRHGIQGDPYYGTEANQLRNYLADLSLENLQEQFKLSDKQAEQVASYYQETKKIAAIDLYQGSVFSQLQPELYTGEQRDYLQAHVVILSALYGIVRPFDGLLPYRLDLKQRIEAVPGTLTHFWQQQLSTQWQNDEIYLNLASSEFAKLLPKQTITVDFVENFMNGKPKRLATYAKIARGQLVHLCIEHAVTTAVEVQQLQTARYAYSSVDSTPTHYVFLKK